MQFDKLALRGLSRDVSGSDCTDPITDDELLAIGYAAASRANSVHDIVAILNGVRLYATEQRWGKALEVLDDMASGVCP